MPVVIKKENDSEYTDISGCSPLDVVETKTGVLMLITVDSDSAKRPVDLRDGGLYSQDGHYAKHIVKNHGRAQIDKESFHG